MARRFIKRKYKKAVKTLAAKVAKITRTLRTNKPELKWAELNSTTETATYSGTSGNLCISLVSGITQGVGDFGNRVGDQLTLKGLRFRMNPNNYGLGYSVTYRLIFFSFLNDPDGATSTASMLNLLMHSSYMGTTNAPMTPYDHDNRSSFKVHYDKAFTLNSGNFNGATGVGESRFHHVNLRIPLKYARVKYYAAGATTTKNELFFTVITNSSSSMPIPYNATLYYIDT